jgi:hypothetical protein
MTALVAGSMAYAVVSGARAQRGDPRSARLDVTRVTTRTSEIVLDPHTGELAITTQDKRRTRQIGLSAVIDGKTRALSIPRSSLHREGETLFADVALEGASGEVPVRVTIKPDAETDSVEITLAVRASIPDEHTLALRADLVPEGGVFLSGTGEIADLGKVSGRILVDGLERALVVASTQGDVSAVLDPPPAGAPGNMHLTINSPEAGIRPQDGPEVDPAPSARGNRTGLVIATAPSTARAWAQAFAALKDKTFPVVGAVWGASERTRVYGLDDEGRPQVRALVDPGVRFQLDAPPTVVSWYAALDSSETSAPVRNVPGSGFELHLDVSPGGELQVHVIDGDTNKPVLARLIVHGVEGTLDPTFGPDFRSSGAGPLVDALHGDLTTPLPKGRYRVAATKGIEWSIDAQTVDIAPGHTRSVQLVLRHVVPTPSTIGCDLHVHARPSFDSPVTVEDRVTSLVSAGIEFAVPSEHNIVGDYAPAIAVLDLGRQLASVNGCEITTFNPKLGHFGVFPYPLGPPPSYRGANAAQIFAAAKKGDPNRVLQVNHPRMPRGIGYFSIAGYDGRNVRGSNLRTDFDALEVYNGYESAERPKVEAVMRDWYGLLNAGLHIVATGSSDSHRIQYQWAGYPRTLARIEPNKGGDGKSTVDTAAVVAAIKKGRSVVTSGPVIELTVDGKGPGEEVVLGDKKPKAHVRVLAAPWIDVTSLELVSQGQVIARIPIPSRPLTLGPEEGTLEEAEARTLRWEGDLDVTFPAPPAPGGAPTAPPPPPANAPWLIAVAKGDRKMDDILPFMAIAPLGFTNPVWFKK